MMKYIPIILAALSAATVQAAAMAKPNAVADPWCFFRGEGCWKEKRETVPVPESQDDPTAWCLSRGEGCWKVQRAADAFANAIRAAHPIKRSHAAKVSNMPGGAAYNAKRGIEDIADALAGMTDAPATRIDLADLLLDHFHPESTFPNATSHPDTEVEATHLTDKRAQTDHTRRWCLFRGEGCWKRDAAPWCLFRGEGCWKRSVPMAAREAEADPWCLFRGEGCWKRTDESPAPTRSARHVALAFCPLEGAAAHTCYASKRDFFVADKRACNQPGEACNVARHAAEALLREIEDESDQQQSSKRDAKVSSDVEARWCLFRGEGCWKRDNMDAVVARCEAEGGKCYQAKRDLAALHTAARNLLEYLSEE